MRKIIALRGKANVGKTTSIREFFNRLQRTYNFEVIVSNNSRNTKEIFTIIKLDNIIIGIASAGDNEEIVEGQLEEFQRYNCNIIICACRTRGGSYKKIVEHAELFKHKTEFIDVVAVSDETRKILFNHFYYSMHYEIQNWLQQLEKSNILVRGTHKDNALQHLNTPAQVIFTKKLIDELKEVYSPDEEKGGFILFDPIRVDTETYLYAKKIVWIPNTADDKRNSYRINTSKHHTAEFSALNSHQLPLAFHTHPAPEGDLVFKALTVTRNLNTSDADKEISFQPYYTGNSKLLLPDILAVGQMNYNEMLFIDVYNGLITPIDLEKYQRELTNDMMVNIGKSIVEGADTDFKKALLFIGGVGALISLFAAPKVSVPLLLGAGAAAPIISMSNQAENNYFGITSSKDFVILIPKVTKEIILENERILDEILEKKKAKLQG